MKIAIIGANGFIGSRLIEVFHLGGQHEVVAIVRQPCSLALPARFALDWRLGDALDAASLANALKGCDAVVHAAIGDPRQIERMPAILCAAATIAGVNRVVYLSSASVHGQNITPGTTEATPLKANFPIEYNNAKVRAENSFFAAIRKHRLSGYALRPGVVYGPRSRWIADLVNELRTGQAWLYEDGSGICNSIYVDNLIHAVSCCLTATQGAGEAYLVGDAETVTWANFYDLAADDVGVPHDHIHALSQLPEFKKTFREKVENAVAQPWMQALLPAVPFKLKQSSKRILASWNLPPSPEAWALPGTPRPHITQEVALLQQNRWRFPHTKASQALGFAPPVTFAEGMRRSLSWLRFATLDPTRQP